MGLKDKNPQYIEGGKTQNGYKFFSIDSRRDTWYDRWNSSRGILPKTVETEEISINYVATRERWNWNDTIINEYLSYNVALDIIMEDKDLEPKSDDDCRCRKDWSK